MYQHLLVATDGSEIALKAVEQGLALALVLRARVTAIHVTEHWSAAAPGEMALSFPVTEYDQGCAKRAEVILSKVKVQALEMGVACETLHVRNQFPAEGILSVADACGCDLIVMASHGRRGLSRLFIGSQASRIVTQSPVPVLVCK